MSHIHSQRYKKFLKQLKKARKEAKMTQAEVTYKLEKPQSFVSKCESGERRVDIIDLSDFAKVYNKPLDFFLA